MGENNEPTVKPAIVRTADRMISLENRRREVITSINKKIIAISGIDSAIKASVDESKPKNSENISFLEDLNNFLDREMQDIQYMENIVKNLNVLI